MMNVRSLDSHFLHGLRRQERPDLGHNGSIKTTNHNGLLLRKPAIDNNDVHRGAEPFDGLDLKNSALKILMEHDLLNQHLGRQSTEQVQQVHHSITRNSRGGNYVQVCPHVLVFIKDTGIQALLRELGNSKMVPLVKLALDSIILHFQSFLNRQLRMGLPSVQSVNLVQGDNKWGFSLLQQSNALNSLRFQSVHDINNEDSHITKRRSTSP
mmetsp:Transcript_35906/g.56013  ORF Transcript_35906/g.56013 Transcript_35906/m.56013 type:complete len:211 (-) Transcript_35906:97-729(-)